MTTKKKIAALAAASLLATGGLALANGRGGGRHGGPGHHKEMLEKFDANKDGKLDDAEREAAHAAMKKEHEARRAEMLKKYDANKDGKLDDAEREKAHAAKAAERFKQLDTNGDGVLSLDEFTKGGPPPHGPRGDH